MRELKEELDIDVQVGQLRPLSFVSFPYPTFHMLMPLYGEWTPVIIFRGCSFFFGMGFSRFFAGFWGSVSYILSLALSSFDRFRAFRTFNGPVRTVLIVDFFLCGFCGNSQGVYIQERISQAFQNLEI